jgi:hypothetical protein
MPIIFQKFIYREDLRANPDAVYLFGDNEKRSGFGGQAKEMRGEPNAIGIRTKKSPGQDESDYWSDDNFQSNKIIIQADFAPVRTALLIKKIVIIPLDGLGTGLSELPTRAPLTHQYINFTIKKLQNIQIYAVD